MMRPGIGCRGAIFGIGTTLGGAFGAGGGGAGVRMVTQRRPTRRVFGGHKIRAGGGAGVRMVTQRRPTRRVPRGQPTVTGGGGATRWRRAQ